ncbi:hypothetical protein AAMO2058_000057800 [Amorphochlora amoebiformis]
MGFTGAFPSKNGDIGGFTSLDLSLSVGSYMIANAGLSVFQKLAIKSLPLPNFLVAVQVSITLLLLLPFWSTIKLGPREDAAKFFPLSVAFFAMLTGSMIAYQFCSLGTIVVLGSVSPLLTLAAEVMFFKRHKFRYSIHTFGSLAITVVGVVLYALFQYQIEAQFVGIIALVSKIVVAIYYQTRQRYLMVEDPIDINDGGMMVYNNAVTLVGSIVVMMIFNEPHKMTMISVDTYGFIYIAASCLFCAFIGYTSFRAQRRVSATSFLIVTTVCKVAVVLFGSLALDEQYSPFSAVGCGMVLSGAAWYGWDRSNVQQSNSAEDLFPKKSTRKDDIEDFNLLEEEELRRERVNGRSVGNIERDF